MIETEKTLESIPLTEEVQEATKTDFTSPPTLTVQ
jgi:hypothetical protein